MLAIFGLLGLLLVPLSGFAQLLRDGSFERIGAFVEPGTGWTVCAGDPDAQVLDGNGPGVFGIDTPPANGQHYVGFVANDQGISEALGQAMTLEAGMHYFGSVSLFRSMAHQNWNGTAQFQIWGGSGCNQLTELLWSSGTVTNLDEWQQFSITFAPMTNHQWIAVRCELDAGSGEMTYLCADDLRLDNVFFSVDFLDFEAIHRADKVDLRWETVALEGALDFDVEWSLDGVDFAEIGKVSALAGESTFDFEHRPEGTGTQFYRIRSVDLGGHEDVSEVRQVNVGAFNIEVFPNPATDRFTVNSALPIDHLTLSDLSGKVVFTQSVDASNYLTVKIPSELAIGCYMLQVFSKGKVSTHRLLLGQ
jgi:hypothetical protein